MASAGEHFQKGDGTARRQMGHVLRARPGGVETSPRERMGATTRRFRLYPRCVDVLRALAKPEARLVWCRTDGKYRINGGVARRDVVIARTRGRLQRLGALRAIGSVHGDLVLTEAGRKLLRRYDKTAEIASRQMEG